MGQYVSRPERVEAFEVSELLQKAREDWEALPIWITSEYDRGRVMFLRGAILVSDGSGQVRAKSNDWIVHQASGLRVYKAGEFTAAFDPEVEQSSQGSNSGKV